MDSTGRVCVVGLAFLIVGACAATRAQAQIDLSGEWAPRLHEDVNHRNDAIGGGPRIGDYTGLPINEAARRRADAWDAAINTVREHQTVFAPAAYWARGGGGMRISKVVDEDTQRVVAFKIFRAGAGGSSTRMIWMDGRPHPPEYAAHTWDGFSTGTWHGDILDVVTTHVKASWIQRNGVPSSDVATISEHIIRHGDCLTIVSVVHDPIYLEEDFVRSTNWVLNLTQQLDAPRGEVADEIADRPEGFVPHHLPGKNPWLKEFGEAYGIPFAATRGGKATTYPEYQREINAR